MEQAASTESAAPISQESDSQVESSGSPMGLRLSTGSASLTEEALLVKSAPAEHSRQL
jgi:hypothetical protein